MRQPIFDVPGVIPEPDCSFRLIVFVPKYAQACGIEREESSGPCIEPNQLAVKTRRKCPLENNKTLLRTLRIRHDAIVRAIASPQQSVLDQAVRADQELVAREGGQRLTRGVAVPVGPSGSACHQVCRASRRRSTHASAVGPASPMP
jgi:hypothetical protein